MATQKHNNTSININKAKASAKSVISKWRVVLKYKHNMTTNKQTLGGGSKTRGAGGGGRCGLLLKFFGYLFFVLDTGPSVLTSVSCSILRYWSNIVTAMPASTLSLKIG